MAASKNVFFRVLFTQQTTCTVSQNLGGLIKNLNLKRFCANADIGLFQRQTLKLIGEGSYRVVAIMYEPKKILEKQYVGVEYGGSIAALRSQHREDLLGGQKAESHFPLQNLVVSF